MAELSVVVHGPNVQDHLTELLDSLAAHPLPDAEVIVAAVGDWARETAERHAPDVQVVPLPDGTGDAAARAAGAARASGRWLHFVHAKDGLPAGTPRTVAERVAELPGEVDVLLLDHVRSTWHTSGMPSPDGAILARAGRADVALDDCAPLLRLTPLLGTRVLRADFWRAHESRLSTDDEPYAALAALLLADRVACLPHVAYEDRRLRPASLPPVTPEQRYGLVERYESLLDLTRDRRAAHTVLYDLMVRDCLRTFARGGMPEEVAREFFRRASLAALRRRPENHRRPAGLEGVRRSLLEEGAYAKYRAFQAVNRTRRTAKSALRTRKRQAGAKLRDHQYRRALSRPVNPHLAVFSAYWNRGVTCNPAAIAAKLAELAPQIHAVWVVTEENAALLPPGTDHVVPGSRRYWEVLATAKYLVNNVNFPDAVVKRPDAIHVQTHHGTPAEAHGHRPDGVPGRRAGPGLQGAAGAHRQVGLQRLRQQPHHPMWERAYPSRYISLDHGYPRNDVYYTAGAGDIRSVRDRLGIAPGRRAVLYAPTHRDYEAGWTPRLDLAALSDAARARTRCCWCAATTSTAAPPPRSRTCAAPAGSSTSPPTNRVEELCLAADAWSRTTPRSCSTTPTSTGRS